jgi:hypothetical protein
MDGVQLNVGEVTRLLRAAREGEPGALEQLVPLVCPMPPLIIRCEYLPENFLA